METAAKKSKGLGTSRALAERSLPSHLAERQTRTPSCKRERPSQATALLPCFPALSGGCGQLASQCLASTWRALRWRGAGHHLRGPQSFPKLIQVKQKKSKLPDGDLPTQGFSTKGMSPPRRCVVVWGHFCCQDSWGGSWHGVGRDQECCSAPHSAQDGPPSREGPSPKCQQCREAPRPDPFLTAMSTRAPPLPPFS